MKKAITLFLAVCFIVIGISAAQAGSYEQTSATASTGGQTGSTFFGFASTQSGAGVQAIANTGFFGTNAQVTTQGGSVTRTAGFANGSSNYNAYGNAAAGYFSRFGR